MLLVAGSSCHNLVSMFKKAEYNQMEITESDYSNCDVGVDAKTQIIEPNDELNVSNDNVNMKSNNTTKDVFKDSQSSSQTVLNTSTNYMIDYIEPVDELNVSNDNVSMKSN
ncbi:uncharacterized protein LOC126550612 [Aphis gossypii]|uniref:uncharacterized protein LOC126550612 n=1 Tax=Aphis gossypii TaxID=80765 RepID=UPI002158DD2A|nr:uncharacterized protein LOC126550612 [Aphis gossypii]